MFYLNERPAIMLREVETGEHIATATINIPKVRIPKNTVFIKDYSENDGMVDALIKAGVIEEKKIVEIQTGHVFVSAHKLTDEATDLFVNKD